MASFKELRDLLAICYDSKMISDEEFLISYEKFQPKNPDFNNENYPAFNLDDISSADCYADFRFQKEHIPRLAQALQLPATFRCEQRSVCDGIEGLCMLLKRVAYPCRYGDMIPLFSRPVSVISLVTNQVLNYIFDIHGHRKTQWNQNIFSYSRWSCRGKRHFSQLLSVCKIYEYYSHNKDNTNSAFQKNLRQFTQDSP